MKTIEKGFIDNSGHEYPELMAIKYDTLDEFKKEKIMFKNKSSSPVFEDPFDEDHGVNIYQNIDNPNIGYRIYRDSRNLVYSSHDDDCSFLEKLSIRQPNVMLTEFPQAIVAIKNSQNYGLYNVIGTQIPYYAEYKNLYDTFFEQKDIINIHYDEIFYIYKECIKILKELYDNGMCYSDVHLGNFMIRIKDLDIKLIDFEKNWVFFNDNDILMIKQLKKLLRSLNDIFGIEFHTELDEAENLDDLNNMVEDEYKLVRGYLK